MNIKQKVFQIAWKILKNGFAPNFSTSLKKAWAIVKMSTGKVVTFAFAKETGEYREATSVQVGSLDTINQGFVRFIEIVENKGQWRSFRIANLLVA